MDDGGPIISDDFMQHMLATSRPYSLMLLRRGPRNDHPDRQAIVWEHGRRNFQLRSQGKICIVCPVGDGGELAGIAIFTTGLDDTKRIMDADPGVQAGVFTYELHPCIGFPGDRLS